MRPDLAPKSPTLTTSWSWNGTFNLMQEIQRVFNKHLATWLWRSWYKAGLLVEQVGKRNVELHLWNSLRKVESIYFGEGRPSTAVKATMIHSKCFPITNHPFLHLSLSLLVRWGTTSDLSTDYLHSYHLPRFFFSFIDPSILWCCHFWWVFFFWEYSNTSFPSRPCEVGEAEVAFFFKPTFRRK